MTATASGSSTARFLIAVICCCCTFACRSRESETTTTRTDSIDRTEQRDRYSEMEATRGQALIVQVQVTSVSATASGVEAAPPPPVGQSATVHGEMNVKTMGSIETLARVGSDFRARANLGTTAALLSGRVTRAGRMDNADRDMYRVSLDFRREEGTSTRSVRTSVDLPIGQPQVVGHLEGAPSENVVLTLRRAGARSSDTDIDRRD